MLDTKDIVVAIYRVGSVLALATTFGFTVVAKEVNMNALWLAGCMAIFTILLAAIADIKNYGGRD